MAVKRYNGTSWETYSGGPVPTSAIVMWKKTAAGGETSLSGNDDNLTSLAYTVGQEQVYVNGILLVRGSDYTAATGTSITFLQPVVNGSVQGLFAGDIVQIWCPTAFQVPSASATASQWRYIAAGGETTLSGVDSVSTSLSYTVGQELVFQNGNLLYRGVDYTATTGISIVLTNALIANDIVNVWSPNAFTVANAIPVSTVTYKGDLIAATGSGTVTNLPAGTNNQVLTADNTTSAGLKWSTPTTSGLVFLSTTTFSGVSSQIITGLGSSSYTNYKLVGNIQSSTAMTLNARFSASGTPFTGSNYSYAVYGKTSGNADVSLAVTAQAQFPIATMNSDSQYLDATVYNLNSSMRKAATWQLMGLNSSSAPAYFTGGVWLDASGTALNEFQLIASTGTISGTVTLYGFNK